MSSFLDVIVRSSAVLTIGLAAVWMLRRQPASLRHWVLAAALALAAAQPLISRVLPSMQIPQLGWATEESAVKPVVETAFSVGPISPGPHGAVVEATDWRRVAFLVWAPAPPAVSRSWHSARCGYRGWGEPPSRPTRTGAKLRNRWEPNSASGPASVC